MDLNEKEIDYNQFKNENVSKENYNDGNMEPWVCAAQEVTEAYHMQNQKSPIVTEGFYKATETADNKNQYIQIMVESLINNRCIESKDAQNTVNKIARSLNYENWRTNASLEGYGSMSPYSTRNVLPQFNSWVMMGESAKFIAGTMYYEVKNYNKDSDTFHIEYELEKFKIDGNTEEYDFIDASRDGTLDEMDLYTAPRLNLKLTGFANGLLDEPAVDRSDLGITPAKSGFHFNMETKNSVLKYQTDTADGAPLVYRETFNLFDLYMLDKDTDAFSPKIYLKSIYYTKAPSDKNEFIATPQSFHKSPTIANKKADYDKVQSYELILNADYTTTVTGGIKGELNALTLNTFVVLNINGGPIKASIHSTLNPESGEVTFAISDNAKKHIKGLEFFIEKMDISNDADYGKGNMESYTQRKRLEEVIVERKNNQINLVPQVIQQHDAENKGKEDYYTFYVNKMIRMIAASKDGYMFTELKKAFRQASDINSITRFSLYEKYKSFYDKIELDLSAIASNISRGDAAFYTDFVAEALAESLSDSMYASQSVVNFDFSNGLWKLLGSQLKAKRFTRASYKSENIKDATGENNVEFKNGFKIESPPKIHYLDGTGALSVAIISSSDIKYAKDIKTNRDLPLYLSFVSNGEALNQFTSVYIPHITVVFQAASKKMSNRESINYWTKDLIKTFCGVFIEFYLNGKVNLPTR